MIAILFLVGLVLIFLCASALVKFSGFLVKKSSISWKHSCIFSAMLFFGTIVLGILRQISPLEIPLFLNIAISVCLEAFLASVYLGSRAMDQSGEAVGHSRAALIGGDSFCSWYGRRNNYSKNQGHSPNALNWWSAWPSMAWTKNNQALVLREPSNSLYLPQPARTRRFEQKD